MAEELLTINAEQYNSLMYVASQMVQTEGIDKKEKLLGNWLKDLPDDRTRALMVDAIIKRAIENSSIARLFLIMLNVPALMKNMGKDRFDGMRAQLRAIEQFRRYDEMFDKLVAKVKSSSTADIIRTKTAMMLQILQLLADRLEEGGLPKCNLDAVDCVNNAFENPEAGEKTMVVDLKKFGEIMWKMVEEILAEGDFAPYQDHKFKLDLSPAMIKQYAEGGGLMTKGAEGSIADRLTEGMIIRKGMNIVKRFALMFRTISMYPPDHPGVQPLLQSILSTLEMHLIDSDHVTLTLVGGKLLIDDVQIKKENKALTDFIKALDDRNLTSVTFNKGVTFDEVKNFCLVFALTEKQLKDKGGVAAILAQKGVSHIVVDQFKYGLVSYDQEDQNLDQVSGDEKMLENIIYADLLNKIKKGEGLDELDTSDLGAAFKKMITGEGGKASSMRKTLARIIVTLDPGLIDKAIFEQDALREELSWSAARKMVEELLDNLGKGDTEARQYTVETLGKLMDVAISRNKDTTLKTAIDKLAARFTKGETDVEVSVTIMEVLTGAAKKLLLQYKFNDALIIINLFREILVRTKYGTPLAANLDDRIKVLQGLCVTALSELSQPEVTETVVDGLKGDDKEVSEACAKIIEKLESDTVIDQVLNIFLDENRSIRNRAYRTLLRFKNITPRALVKKLQTINDPDIFPREEDGSLTTDSWYIVRNAIDLLCELEPENSLELIVKLTEDKDYRVRKECIVMLDKLGHDKKIDYNKVIDVANRLIEDPHEEVREKAILALGHPNSKESVNKLVDLFFEKPEHRKTIFLSFTKIGGEEVNNFLIDALNSKKPVLRKIYKENEELRLNALKILGRIGDEHSAKIIKKYVKYYNNPFIRMLYLMNAKKRRLIKERVEIASKSLAQMEQRLQRQQQFSEAAA